MLESEFKSWQDVVHLIAGKPPQDSSDLSFVLSVLLTQDERDSLLTRMNILYELIEARYSQRQISQMLGVGIATVTRGSNQLKSISLEDKAKLQALLTKTLACSSKKETK